MARLVKTAAGLAIASVKTVQGLALASVKTIGGVDNTGNGLLTGLMAYWPLNEASGNFADSSGNGYTLTDVNDANITNDTTNYKLTSAQVCADATTTNRARNTSANFIKSAAFTICGWARATTFSATAQFAWSKYAASGNQRSYGLTFVNAAGNKIRFVVSTDGSSNAVTLASAQTLSTNTWYFIACGWDGTNGWVSVNDETRVTGAVATPFTSTAAFALFNDDGFSVPFQGQIDEVGVWDKTISAAEQTLLYGAGTPPGYGAFS